MEKSFKSVQEVLNFAIQNEEDSALFYQDLMGMVDRPKMRRVLREFVDEEKEHRKALLQIKAGEFFSDLHSKIGDLKISDYTVEAQAKSHMDYQDLLVLAMQREKAAFRLYSDLADATRDPKVQNILVGLAKEEARHKLKFETEYDEILREEN